MNERDAREWLRLHSGDEVGWQFVEMRRLPRRWLWKMCRWPSPLETLL